MARIQWVKDRLDNWARWVVQRTAGASGYPKAASFTREMGASSSTDSMMIPVNDIEARQTHDVIEGLRVLHSGLWLVVQCRYVGDPQARPSKRRPLATSEIAARMSVCARAVQRQLEDADMVIGGRLRALDEVRQRVPTAGLCNAMGRA